MRCSTCRTVNPAGNRFCEGCGARQGPVCPHCGHAHRPAARFCGGCGLPIEVSPLPATSAAAARQWGELKQATVLFADIVGSTELIAAMDPEQAMEKLRPAVLRMCQVVESVGGTVVRTLGDGILALFGVPRSLEGHALLACEAALNLQKVFSEDTAGLTIRVGLHSGQVASDPADADGTRGGGAHGVTIHLASRVVAMAAPGGICLTEHCHALVRASCDVESMGSHVLRGIAGTTALYSLKGLKQAALSQRFPQAGHARFRGRAGELEMLRGAWAQTGRGQAQVVGISAPPGAGKSRLCHEFSQWCRTQDVPVFEVRAQLYGHATPLQPVLELMRVFFYCIAAGDDPATARKTIAQRLPQGASQADLALVQEFLGVAQSDTPPSALAPKARHERLKALLREHLRDAADTPAVIVIEDVHWLDEASWEFVGALVEAVAGTRSMLVLNYRPSFEAPWRGLPHFRQQDLPELSASDAHALLRDLIGAAPALDAVRRLVVQRSAGNPFFAEELVRSLRESGVLSVTGEVSGGLDAVERALPATVQAVIGARLDRLGEPGKTLLQMCAIIGKEIPLAVLEHVARPIADQIQEGLDLLCRADLVIPDAADSRRFAFRHPLIQEVAYGAQLKVRRGQLHALVAGAMETYYREQLDEYAGLVAYHYEAAGHRVKASEHAGRAARWVGSTNPALAIRHWHKVRSLLQDEPRATEIDRRRAIACSKIVFLGWREGLALDEARPFIDEAVELARESDARLAQLLLFVEGRMLQASGGPADGYVEKIKTALSLQPTETQPGRTATLNAALSQAYGWAGMLHEALAASDASLAHVDSIDAFDLDFIGFSVEHWVLGMRARLLVRLGRHEEAEQCLLRIFKSGEPGGSTGLDPVLLLIAHYGYIDLAWCRSDAAMARHHADAVSAMVEKSASPYMRVVSMTFQAMAHGIADRQGQAASLYTQALALLRAGKVAIEMESEILAGLAECHRRMGHFDDSLAFAREAVSIARQRTIRLAECRALITWGAALAQHRPGGWETDSASCFAQAGQLVERSGAVIFGDLLRKERGEIEAARRLASGVA
jgi:class 3 adenylate cyclase/tetratricopeptide (TPR) repeat protein